MRLKDTYAIRYEIDTGCAEAGWMGYKHGQRQVRCRIKDEIPADVVVTQVVGNHVEDVLGTSPRHPRARI